MTTAFILGFSSVQFLRMTMTFQDGGAGFISQSMKRNSDFDNISVRIWMNSIGEKVAFLYKNATVTVHNSIYSPSEL